MQIQDNRLSSLQGYFKRSMGKTDIHESEHAPMFRLLCAHYLKLSSAQILLADEQLLSESEILKMLEAIKAIKKGRPIQYILGETEFMGLRILCNEGALIPRPETEELAQWIFDQHQDIPNGILDIGTGTGCIALSLAQHFKTCKVSALDAIPEALALAERNAKALQLKVNFIEDDILSPNLKHENYGLIVSNPPYVCRSEINDMKANVLEHEPHSALFVENDEPLLFYKAISQFALDHLAPNGWLYFEINEKLGKETLELMSSLGISNLELRKDLFGKDRMIRGQKAEESH